LRQLLAVAVGAGGSVQEMFSPFEKVTMVLFSRKCRCLMISYHNYLDLIADSSYFLPATVAEFYQAAMRMEAELFWTYQLR